MPNEKLIVYCCDINTLTLCFHICEISCQKFGYGGWCQIRHKDNGKAEMVKDGQQLFRVVETNCWCPEARIADMNKTGQIE